MDNVVQVDTISVSAGTLVTSIRLLRAINCAARLESVHFTVQLSFSYPVAGVVVTTPVTSVLVSATKTEESTDPVWQGFLPPAIPVAHAPDAGAQITCNAKITIVDNSNNSVDVGYLDTAVLTPT